MTLLKYAYPDIPKRAATITSSHSYSSSAPKENLVLGSRAKFAELATAVIGQHDLDFDLGSGVTASADHLGLVDAKMLGKSGCASVVLRGSSASANTPINISGCRFWYDAAKNYTLDSSHCASAQTERAGSVASTSSTSPIITRADNRGNLTHYSRTPSGWTVTNASRTDNSAQNYDGSYTAGTVTASAGAGLHCIQQSSVLVGLSPVAYAGQQYRITFWCKRVNHDYLWLGEYNDSAYHGCCVNVSSGVITTQTGVSSATIADVGNGWWKVDIVYTRSSSTGGFSPGFYISATNASNGGTSGFSAAGTEQALFGGVSYRLDSWDSDEIVTTNVPQFAGVNGNRAALSFKTNRGLTYPDASNIRLTGDCTIAFAFKFWEVQTGYHVIANKNTGTSSGWVLALNVSSATSVAAQLFNYNAGATSVQSSGFNPSGETQVLVCVKSGTTVNWYRNGVAAGSGSITSAASSTATLKTNSSSDPVNGFIGEMVIYDSALGTTDRQSLENYLISKWRTAPVAQTHTLDTATLSGPTQEEYYSMFAASTAYRYWWLQFDSESSSKRPLSKALFGTALDLGRDPLYTRDVEKLTGAAHERDAAFALRLSYEGLTNSVRDSFFETIGKFSETPVMAIATTYTHALASWGCAYALLTAPSYDEVVVDVNALSFGLETLI